MSMELESDEELMARMAEGDEEALVLLMRKYFVHMAKYARPLLRRHDLAQEAVLNVFISIWRRRETLSLRGNLRNYLYGAVHRQAMVLLTIETAGPRLLSLEELPSQQLVTLREEERILYRELANEIEDLLASMPPQRQQVFRMSRIENMRYKEIGEALGISEFTVRGHIAKATRALEDALPAIKSRLRGDAPERTA